MGLKTCSNSDKTPRHGMLIALMPLKGLRVCGTKATSQFHPIFVKCGSTDVCRLIRSGFRDEFGSRCASF